MIIEQSQHIIDEVSKVFIGKDEIIKKVLMTIYAGGTVDRVIHQRGRVAPEVEKRIRDIMDENDYHPYMLGRALAVSKTPLTIGMIMIEKGNPFFQ